MKEKMKLFTLASALLLLAAACSRDDNAPGAQPEGGIALTPTVALNAGWNTGADTRADQKVPVALAAGGKISLILAGVDEALDKPDANMQMNNFEVTADGKLSRIPFSGEEMETEEPLNIAAPGQYFTGGGGEVNFTTDGITYRSYIADPNQGTKVNIGADGKLTLAWKIYAAGLRLNVKGTDGAAYAGADVSATLKTVSQYDSKTFEVKTLTAVAPSAIWGDIGRNSVVAGAQLLELTVGGKTYRVNAPRQISFTRGRLYTFNVRVGATSITVSSDDLAIGDFEVQASTSAEADNIPHYNGQPAKLLALPGKTAYWVAPVNAATSVAWTAVDFNTVCPAGWHVPTKDEFVAMMGPGANWSPASSLFITVTAAFPHNVGSANTCYWSSTGNNTELDYAYFMSIQDDLLVPDNGDLKSNSFNVRCVKAK